MPLPVASRTRTVCTETGPDGLRHKVRPTPACLRHKITPTASTKTTMPIATGQNRDVDSGSALRSMRRSSSVGLGELIDKDRAQGTAFSPQGQLWSAGRRGAEVRAVKCNPAY